VTYVSQLVPRNLQSAAQAFFGAVTVGVAGFAGGALGGGIAQRYGFAALYAGSAGVALVALVLLLTTVPNHRATSTRAC
jgi:MFS family permease